MLLHKAYNKVSQYTNLFVSYLIFLISKFRHFLVQTDICKELYIFKPCKCHNNSKCWKILQIFACNQ
ncbi:hypothetical protein DMR_24890 [Solidesulfovibrio magneticus RS-1]|uniref:Uncharacterized protein n=1 Tax=Solidesulfovibrio magneticus (strain ATCC 700980 / DSM 13731 / RS-1) TaxID=573370 RepID=C4XTI3_SOLM1|nr:hypothetical protein DMR_24890 [Solidesulfovibrio magneticus RS-1]